MRAPLASAATLTSIFGTRIDPATTLPTRMGSVMGRLVKSLAALGALLMAGAVSSQANTLFPSGGNLGSDTGLGASIGADVTQKSFADDFTSTLTPGVWDPYVSLTDPFKLGADHAVRNWAAESFEGTTLLRTGHPGFNGFGRERNGLMLNDLKTGGYALVTMDTMPSLKSAYSGPFSVGNIVPISDTLPLFASGLAVLTGLIIWHRKRRRVQPVA
ncbi:MAG TPA: hypothetical protein VKW08_07420 [Xanthobacteraceae bacterium]|nr:hypothetical protein [Xanthobacteraceae bacterium]